MPYPEILSKAVNSLVRRVHRGLPPGVMDPQLVSAFRARSLAVPLEAEGEWLKFLVRTKDHIRTDDMHRFLEWDVIRQTMFVGGSSYAHDELTFLKSQADWPR
jgi:hypothetical protein